MPKVGARPTNDPTRTRARNGIRIEVGQIDAPAPVVTPTRRARGPMECTHAESKATARVIVGDCRQELVRLPDGWAGAVDLIFADPPFNWNRGYDRWVDAMPEVEYLAFTYDWLDACCRALRPGGALWVNIPDDWAAEIVCYLKGRSAELSPGVRRGVPCRMDLENWCVWHYRFGQNTTARFINSKVHALYFVKHAEPGQGERTWVPEAVLELSDRAAIYGDQRTLSKRDGMPAGKRVPMDVWYGPYFGRVQGNSKERRHYHDNQLPEAYLARVVLACSRPGDKVLDPFLGSGTTGVVAHALGREFVGIEFSEHNAGLALDRIKRGPARPLEGGAAESSAIGRVRRKLKGGSVES
jgi:site-specific DNA-methyltransferase (adenine-specific)